MVAIRGLDASVVLPEVMEALDDVGIVVAEIADVRLGELRDGWTGRRTAIVRLQKRAAQMLLTRGTLTVGWAKCQARVTEYERDTWCCGCQQFGHPAWQCKEKETTTRKCYRCGSEDHIAKECAVAPKCYGCGQEGHRADSPRCPKRRQQATAADGKPPRETTAQRRIRRRAMEVDHFEEDEEDAPPGAPMTRGTENDAEKEADVGTEGARTRENDEEMETEEPRQERDTNDDDQT